MVTDTIEDRDDSEKDEYVVDFVAQKTYILGHFLGQLIEEAELEWIFLHPLPRTDVEVSDDVFLHKNNLTWQACQNHLYIAMAFIVSALTDYQPKSPMPPFDGL